MSLYSGGFNHEYAIYFPKVGKFKHVAKINLHSVSCHLLILCVTPSHFCAQTQANYIYFSLRYYRPVTASASLPATY